MRRLLSTSVFLLLSFLPVIAQGQFVKHIESEAKDQGSVRIIQDSLLTEIINGNFIPTEVEKKKSKTKTVGNSVMKIKKRGYRIQVYKGGNTRAAETAARNMGRKIQQKFDLEPYTIFNNPEWVCRVGDFKNREDALEYLQKIKVICRGAMIVPSEIYVNDN